jgi:hypothetical protein
MKTCGRVEGIDTSFFFFNFGTNWRWMVSFTPLPLYPRGRTPGTHWVGGRVSPRAGLDDTERWKFVTLPGPEFRHLHRPALSQSLNGLPCRGSYDTDSVVIKAILLTGREGLQRCEMLKIPLCLDSQITDGGEVSPTHLPLSTPQKHYFSASCAHFC